MQAGRGGWVGVGGGRDPRLLTRRVASHSHSVTLSQLLAKLLSNKTVLQ